MTMKVLHVPYCFHPDPVGGTEVYVEALAHELEALGVETVITAPGDREVTYDYDGLRVRRYAVSSEVADLQDLYGEGDSVAAQGFARILDEERPDVVHLHAFTRGVSLRLVRETKRRGIPVVFTYHTPTVSCQRGTLMRWGTEVCDGVLDVHRCAACTLTGLGLNRVFAHLLGRLPSAAGRVCALARLSGSPWTALRMTELIELRHIAFRALMNEVDHVVALCRWTKGLLIRNGVPAEKITVSRHGLPQALSDSGREVDLLLPAHGPLRVVYLGRLDPTKGPDILIRAVRVLPEAPVELHLFGIVQGAAGEAYLQQLKKLAADDPAVTFLPPVSSDQVVPLLRRYHLLAVPSRFETGPLVVLEAFAAGVPVIGSRLGGIAECVEDGVNGLLVEPYSVEAWREALQRLVSDKGLLSRLRCGIRPPRSMGDVARDMAKIYFAIYQRVHVTS